jgi:hypothetical protein
MKQIKKAQQSPDYLALAIIDTVRQGVELDYKEILDQVEYASTSSDLLASFESYLLLKEKPIEEYLTALNEISQLEEQRELILRWLMIDIETETLDFLDEIVRGP